MAARALGWQITLRLAEGGAPRLYDIADEHEAVDGSALHDGPVVRTAAYAFIF
jgi:hypothetical protein